MFCRAELKDPHSLVAILDLLRSQGSYSRPELALLSKLGRTVIAQRVGQLIELGLAEDGDLGPSTGGREPRRVRFRAGAGHILAAVFGDTGVSVGSVDLRGNLLAQREEPCDIALGPERTLERLDVLFAELLAARHGAPTRLWGIGIGLPGPVEFATGRSVAPPIMPGWDGYRVRDRLAAHYGVPVWVDNEVNTMAGLDVTAADVAAAAQHGDALSVELLSRCGHLVGEALATVVNIFNPSLILIGGSVAKAGDLILAAIRETVYRRSLPLATRELRIAQSSLGDTAGVIGAAFMVIDELFSRGHIERWIETGYPNETATAVS